MDYCGVFIRCLDSHSDGTHSLQSIHWWNSDEMLHFSKSDEETNSSTSLISWGWVYFQQIFIFWWLIPLISKSNSYNSTVPNVCMDTELRYTSDIWWLRCSQSLPRSQTGERQMMHWRTRNSKVTLDRDLFFIFKDQDLIRKFPRSSWLMEELINAWPFLQSSMRLRTILTLKRFRSTAGLQSEQLLSASIPQEPWYAR